MSFIHFDLENVTVPDTEFCFTETELNQKIDVFQRKYGNHQKFVNAFDYFFEESTEDCDYFDKNMPQRNIIFFKKAISEVI